MTAARNPKTSPVFRTFRELSNLPPAERTEALMVRLEHVWDEAQARHYTNKHGDEIPNPDTAVMLKVVQAVAVLQGLTGEPSKDDSAKLERMTDAELVREATKRLPPAQVAELADMLIAQREQQLTATIETTGETADEQRKPADEPGEPGQTEGDRPGAEEPNPEWA